MSGLRGFKEELIEKSSEKSGQRVFETEKKVMPLVNSQQLQELQDLGRNGKTVMQQTHSQATEFPKDHKYSTHSLLKSMGVSHQENYARATDGLPKSNGSLMKITNEHSMHDEGIQKGSTEVNSTHQNFY